VWFQATKDPAAPSDLAVFDALETASQQLDDERDTARDKILEDVALQRTPAVTARADLDALLWADGALYHAWRLAESLRIASGNRQLPVDKAHLSGEEDR
jgi:phosphate:Na+ symporter